MESNHKLKIAVFIDWFIPAFRAGGPIRSVSNMVEQLKDEFDFYIFTSCYDLGSNEPLDVPVNQWVEKDGTRVKYFSSDNTTKKVFQSNLENINPDIIYINSMYSRKFAIWPLRIADKMDVKTVLAPRGMLSRGAIELKKNKKKAFLTYAKTMGWFRGVNWHATSEDELKSIQKNISKSAVIHFAPNLPEIFEKVDVRNVEKVPGELNLVFLGRISKVKNLHSTLKMLGAWKQDGKVTFDIYGPEEDQDYAKQCLSLSKKIKDVKVCFKGQIPSDEVKKKIAEYHFLISSTSNENYGHAITEAFSVGLPVIISDQTPWKDLSEKGIGYDISLDNENDWHYALSKCLSMNQKKYDEMSAKALDFYQKKIVSKKDIEDHINLFNQAYGK